MLWWARLGRHQAAPDPLGKRFAALEPGGGDADPATHRAAAHHDRLGVRRAAEIAIGPNHQPAAPRHSECHVAAHQEREAAEHTALADRVDPVELLAHPPGQILVVGHALYTVASRSAELEAMPPAR